MYSVSIINYVGTHVCKRVHYKARILQIYNTYCWRNWRFYLYISSKFS